MKSPWRSSAYDLEVHGRSTECSEAKVPIDLERLQTAISGPTQSVFPAADNHIGSSKAITSFTSFSVDVLEDVGRELAPSR
jgi:hypothetical protein